MTLFWAAGAISQKYPSVVTTRSAISLRESFPRLSMRQTGYGGRAVPHLVLSKIVVKLGTNHAAQG